MMQLMLFGIFGAFCVVIEGSVYWRRKEKKTAICYVALIALGVFVFAMQVLHIPFPNQTDLIVFVLKPIAQSLHSWFHIGGIS